MLSFCGKKESQQLPATLNVFVSSQDLFGKPDIKTDESSEEWSVSPTTWSFLSAG